MQWQPFEKSQAMRSSKYDKIKAGMFVVAKFTESQKELLITPPFVSKIGKGFVKIMIGGRANIGFVGASTGYKIQYGGRSAKAQMGRIAAGTLIKDFPHIRNLDVFEVVEDHGVHYIDTYKPMTLDEATATLP